MKYKRKEKRKRKKEKEVVRNQHLIPKWKKR